MRLERGGAAPAEARADHGEPRRVEGVQVRAEGEDEADGLVAPESRALLWGEEGRGA